MYDYSARYYEPAIGRFTTVDPLVEKYYSWSPYSFVLGSPIRNIDPLVMVVWRTNDSDQIARFLNHLQAVAGGKTADPFDYGGWNRMTNEEYKEHNKDNSVSFNDDTFNFNINMGDYQGNLKAGMRSKETNYAYITPSDLDDLFAPNGDAALDLYGNLAGLGVGSALWYTFGGGIHKNSALAKKIFARSTTVGEASTTTSLLSSVLHRQGYGKLGTNISVWYLPRGKSLAGQISKLSSRTLGPIGYGLVMYDTWTISRNLGYWYGGDAVVRGEIGPLWLRNIFTPTVPAPDIKPPIK